MSFIATTIAIELDSYIISKPLSSKPWTNALTNMAKRNIIFKIWSISYYYSVILLLPLPRIYCWRILSMFLTMLVYLKARARGKNKIYEPGTILPTSFSCCISSTYYARSQRIEANFQSHPGFLTLDLSVPQTSKYSPSKHLPFKSNSSEQWSVTFFHVAAHIENGNICMARRG